MFYPVTIDLSDPSRIERATVVLNPAASKRLIGKAVADLPEVKRAYKNGRLSVSTGTTCDFVLEELTGEKIDPYRYCVGMVADGMLTSSVVEDRRPARFFVKGRGEQMEALNFFDTFEKGDLVIKGGERGRLRRATPACSRRTTRAAPSAAS